MNGATPLETYTGTDIAGLAKVFTGYSWRCSDWTDNSCFYSGKPSGAPSADKPDWASPMMSYLQFYSEDSKAFLGKTIAAASPANPANDLKLALDALANHPNVGPFIGKQLIQRLVTSNPSPKYVSDISAVFANNGSGVRGDMKAVVKAILMHPEARVLSDTSGKVREPILRMTAFMRAFGHQSLSGYYWMNSTDNPGTQLGPDAAALTVGLQLLPPGLCGAGFGVGVPRSRGAGVADPA